MSTEFDPMLAKVVMAAPTRTEAALGLASALDRTRLGGVVTNRDFLSAVLRSDEFLAGDTTTDFIDRTGLATDSPPYRGLFLHAAASAVALVSQARNRELATALGFMTSGYRNSVMPDEVLPLTALDSAAGDVDVSVAYRRQRDGSYRLRVAPLQADAPYAPPDDDEPQQGDGVDDDSESSDGAVPDSSEFVLRPHSIQIHPIFDDSAGGVTDAPPAEQFDAELDVETGGMRGTWQISRRGHDWYVTGPLTGSATLRKRSRFPDPDAETVEGGLVAPMPGKVLMVDVSEGDRGARGPGARRDGSHEDGASDHRTGRRRSERGARCCRRSGRQRRTARCHHGKRIADSLRRIASFWSAFEGGRAYPICATTCNHFGGDVSGGLAAAAVTIMPAATLRRCVGSRCGQRHLWRDCGRTVRGHLRARSPADRGRQQRDGGRDGGRLRHTRRHSSRGVHGRDAGWLDPGAHRCSAHRQLCLLHAVLGDCRVHLRHRRNDRRVNGADVRGAHR